MFRVFADTNAENAQANGAPILLRRDNAPSAPLTDLKVHLHQKLLEVLNLGVLEKLTRGELQLELTPIIRKMVDAEGLVLSPSEYRQLTEEVLDEVLGLGPLEPFLKDPTVTDILVNTHQAVFVERRGQLEATEARFKDERHLMRIIQKIVTGVGRRVDESQPFMDARLADGSRVNVLVPPCAVDGPLLSIRKFSKTPYTMDRIVEIGSITQEMAALFQVIVATRRNVLISGGTGSGKTTLLNALSSYIDNRERILTIEDTAELQLQQRHVCRIETRPPNLENTGEVTQRDLLKNALRMRPDRIIVGEVRGAEVLDMLQAMNTGHDGSMTTVHANTPRDALTRLEHMVGMTGLDLPQNSLKGQIASAIHVVIQQQRMSDGRRRVTSIQEILGMESGTVTMQEIYRFERTGMDSAGNIQGQHRATGVRPKFLRLAEEYGIPIPDLLKRSV
jgi:pilus assembly protein CpaF